MCSLSDEGAGLDVMTSAWVLKNFELVIKADDFAKSCQVTSHSEKYMSSHSIRGERAYVRYLQKLVCKHCTADVPRGLSDVSIDP